MEDILELAWLKAVYFAEPKGLHTEAAFRGVLRSIEERQRRPRRIGDSEGVRLW